MIQVGRLALLLVLPIVGVVTGAPPAPGPAMYTYPVVTVTEDVP